MRGQLNAFYKIYLHALNANGDQLPKRQTMSRYVSERLLTKLDKLSKIEGGIEADPFICAQDFDKAWERNTSVKDVKIDGAKASAEVDFTGPEMSQRLRVKLVKAAGDWKIDDVGDLNAH